MAERLRDANRLGLRGMHGAHEGRVAASYRQRDTPFEDLATCDGELHSTFRAACFAKGLMSDDAELKAAFQEIVDRVSSQEALTASCRRSIGIGQSDFSQVHDAHVSETNDADTPAHAWSAHSSPRLLPRK